MPTTSRRRRTPSTTPVTDFGRYQPHYDEPTAWAVSPLGTEGVTRRAGIAGPGPVRSTHHNLGTSPGRPRGSERPVRRTWPGPTRRCGRCPERCCRTRTVRGARARSRRTGDDGDQRPPAVQDPVCADGHEGRAARAGARAERRRQTDYLGREALVAYARCHWDVCAGSSWPAPSARRGPRQRIRADHGPLDRR